MKSTQNWIKSTHLWSSTLNCAILYNCGEKLKGTCCMPSRSSKTRWQGQSLGWIRFQKIACGFTATNLSHCTILEWTNKKRIVKIRAILGVPQARSKTRWKYKRNGHYFDENFVLSITFCHFHIFRNRFDCWSAFLLYFKGTPMKTILMAIIRRAIMAKIGKWP